MTVPLEMPVECDRCKAPFTKGSEFYRIELVMDGSPARVGHAEANVEHQYRLCLCASCNGVVTNALFPDPPEAPAPDFDDRDEVLLEVFEDEARSNVFDPLTLNPSLNPKPEETPS